MLKLKTITKEQLKKEQDRAISKAKEWTIYVFDLNEFEKKYNKATKEGTTPPGNPPKPPG